MKKLKMFQPYQLKNLSLSNRIVFPPMDLYCAQEDGKATDEHFVHYLSRAIGGTGMIILEATAVAPEGRISDRCLGLWDDAQIDGLARIAEGVRSHGSKAVLQLNHAGRKCTAKGQELGYTLAPSPVAFDETYRVPREMDREDIQKAVEAFRAAAKRADQAGFDAIEIHGAHGYLISEFLSPLTNQRTDEYGGSLANRTRFLDEVLEAVRAVWPDHKAIMLRLSATDHLADGNTVEDAVQIVDRVKDRVDLFHISSGGVAKAPIDVFPGYQVELAAAVRSRCGVPVITVGLVTERATVEEILGNGRADLVAMGRALFRNPYWVMQQAFQTGQEYDYPEIYQEAFLDKLR